MRDEVTSDENIGAERFSDDWEAKAPAAIKAAKAIAVDGSGYFAAVRCTEEFGCVLHQPKE